MGQGVITLTDGDFDQALKEETPILVDFWAEWCPPCKALAPVLDELASEYGATVRIAKVNVDDNPALATKFRIRSIPNLLLFRKGEQIGNIVGALSKGDLKAKIDNYLG